MKLNVVERSILANLNRVRASLTSDDDEKRHFESAAEAFEGGFEREYAEYLKVGADDDTLSEDDCKEVVEILEMYDYIRIQHESLKGNRDPNDFVFPGFDSHRNLEGRMRAYCVFLRKNEVHPDIPLESHNFNSHASMLDAYRRMLEVYRATRTSPKYDLTLDQIDQILDARYLR